jgi:hypothetical protein
MRHETRRLAFLDDGRVPGELARRDACPPATDAKRGQLADPDRTCGTATRQRTKDRIHRAELRATSQLTRYPRSQPNARRKTLCI